MDKYYTPSAEEFYIGFEYEEFCRSIVDSNGEWYTNPSWVKKEVKDFGVLKGGSGVSTSKDNIYSSFTPYCLTKQNDNVTPNYGWDTNIRVKYLDREDIESLGWINNAIRAYQNKSGNCLYIHLDGNIIILKSATGTCVFDGTIKNKSELRRIMKMLQIS